MSSVERTLSLFSPSHVLLQFSSIWYIAQWNIVVHSSITGVILHSIMKSIKTPNHPAYHWSTLSPLEVWVRGLYNSWWFCVHKLSMFIYWSMVMKTMLIVPLGESPETNKLMNSTRNLSIWSETVSFLRYGRFINLGFILHKWLI